MTEKNINSQGDIENLVERRIAEAKLAIAESRLHFALWFGGAAIAVFGVFIPMYQASNASREVASAIEKSEKRTAEAVARVDDAINTIQQVADLRIKQFIEKSINPHLQKMDAKLDDLDPGPIRIKWNAEHKVMTFTEINEKEITKEHSDAEEEFRR